MKIVIHFHHGEGCYTRLCDTDAEAVDILAGTTVAMRAAGYPHLQLVDFMRVTDEEAARIEATLEPRPADEIVETVEISDEEAAAVLASVKSRGRLH